MCCYQRWQRKSAVYRKLPGRDSLRNDARLFWEAELTQPVTDECFDEFRVFRSESKRLNSAMTGEVEQILSPNFVGISGVLTRTSSIAFEPMGYPFRIALPEVLPSGLNHPFTPMTSYALREF